MSDSALRTRRCTVLTPVLKQKRMLRCHLRTGVFLSLQQQNVHFSRTFFIFSPVLRMTFLFYIKDENIKRLKYSIELELILLLFSLFRG